MVVWGEESARIEESVRKIGVSGSREAAEGLVQLGKNIDEPVPSEQETLADLLKRVTASYNPKKKGSSGVNTPGTARANKKRKATSSIPVEIPPTRGRATKSQKKQSEAELDKVLEESKRKTAAKGKKKSKSAEPSILAKRTRSAMKSRKVKIVEEEEWSREEEENDSDDEKDKMIKFGKRTILKGRLLRDLEEE
ncbi:protein pxr1-like [Nicotiana tomentosiformis]|uniref:protein pxr1-like n=1 Tax=Nicotiana tomentosiformis TaxID=4098 RepID=UPI00388C67AB